MESDSDASSVMKIAAACRFRLSRLSVPENRKRHKTSLYSSIICNYEGPSCMHLQPIIMYVVSSGLCLSPKGMLVQYNMWSCHRVPFLSFAGLDLKPSCFLSVLALI